MALRALVKAAGNHAKKGFDKTSVVHLYRAIIKELPRVLTIYDVGMPIKEAQTAVSFHFRKNSKIQDGRIIGLLLAKGYMELEETLMQWKQKTHLLRILEPQELQLSDNGKKVIELTDEEKLIRGVEFRLDTF